MVGRNFLEHESVQQFEVLAPSSRELNLLDAAECREYLRRARPDLIIHAAGKVGGIQANIKEPAGFFLENLDMGRNLVGAALECGVKKMINLGSSCMYPRAALNPLREEMILQGELEPTNEGYALAKVAIARLCEYVRFQYPDFAYKTLIPCNLYGRWDKFDPNCSHLIPAIIHKLHDAKRRGADRVEIWGDGSAMREFMYAQDMADCLVRAAEKFDTLPQYMNVGTGRDYSVAQYYEAAARVVGYAGTFTYDISKPVGMKKKLVDVTKLREWGWRNATTLDDGLSKTYEYYLQHVAQEDAG